jgi:hypothetical protein
MSHIYFIKNRQFKNKKYNYWFLHKKSSILNIIWWHKLGIGNDLLLEPINLYFDIEWNEDVFLILFFYKCFWLTITIFKFLMKIFIRRVLI